MIDMNEIRKEIKKLECGPTTFSNCEKLAMLYTICDHAKGMEMADAYERRERAAEKWEEKEYKTTATPMMYHANPSMPFDMAMADAWMAGLENEDGTKGPHWTIDQVKQVMAQKGWKEDPLRGWVTLNLMYSDYFNTAKKSNVNNLDFYISMAKDFLSDKDAVEDKLSAYYNAVVK